MTVKNVRAVVLALQYVQSRQYPSYRIKPLSTRPSVMNAVNVWMSVQTMLYTKPLIKKFLLQKKRIQLLILSIISFHNPTKSWGVIVIEENKEYLIEVEDYWIKLKKLQTTFFKLIHHLAEEEE